ncbi:protein PTHB1 [Chrysoperla carnea]|uniref:protein PTHB1 n=1 Tax=Chrysoperla carnea TaxID=189513 RepID=UPI001D061AD0|nr:protein PTHB1 [Chrysoperla carnea]
MSLFNTRNYWSTICGDKNTEVFDSQCICLSQLNSEFDKILIGNHDGFLWIFEPKSERSEDGTVKMGYRAIDQLLEVQLTHPVIQIGVGRLVSGSQEIFIGILHPQSFVVYNLVTKKGLADHGDQSQLLLIYEHKLQRSSANFVLGSFGGVNKRDFTCIQSLDGVLTFFEQEVFVFCCFLPEFLLPGPIVYVPRSDLFVTMGSDWNVHAYRYQLLSDAGVLSNESQTTGKRLISDWTYELSESTIDMVSLPNNSFEDYIVILGEHNLYCMNDLGKLKFMKRFEFIPLCFHPYLLENKLMILVVSDTKTLLVYEAITLRWSAQIDFLPVAIVRGNFNGLQGGITLLSETGDVQCCYLGTNPSQYIVPPLVNQDIDFAVAEEELQILQKDIDSRQSVNVIISCITINGVPRVLRKFGQIPLRLASNVCAPVKESAVKITLNTTEPVVSLATLFPEFAGESALSLSSNAIGFVQLTNPSNIVTILAAKSSQRYRLQSDSIASLNYLTQDLILRLKKHFIKQKDFNITQTSTSLPISQLLDAIDRHFKSRQNVLELQTESAQYATQYRMIEKRLMSKLKEKTPSTLTNLQMLLDDTNDLMLKSLYNLEESFSILALNQTRLSSTLYLILLLIELSGVPKSIYLELKSALNCSVVENDNQGWEDVVDISLNHLLRTVFAKSEKDTYRANVESLTRLEDINKFKKHLHNILERVMKNMQFTTDLQEDIENETIDEEKPSSLQENPNTKQIIPIGSRLGELRTERPPSGRAKTPALLQVLKRFKL